MYRSYVIHFYSFLYIWYFSIVFRCLPEDRNLIFARLFESEDGGSTFHRNVGEILLSYIMSIHRRHYSS
jgi:hypothetical protein